MKGRRKQQSETENERVRGEVERKKDSEGEKQANWGRPSDKPPQPHEEYLQCSQLIDT